MGSTDTASNRSASLPPLRDVIARYGLGARKSLGQHFLLDGNLTGRIARAAGDLSRGTVIEVGPGPGGLTRALLAAGAAEVLAIEKDRRCIEALQGLKAAYPDRLVVLDGDALKTDAAGLGSAPRRIVSNLPYNAGTPLLLSWLKALAERPDSFDSLTLMFQKEVAQRLAATPRGKAYGRLSVMTQWLCEVRSLFDVPPQAFTPPPKVVSAVVRLEPRARPLAPARRELLEAVTAAAFGQRRKMLRRSLHSLRVETARLIDLAEVEGTARAEDIDIAGFCALARGLAELRGV